MVRSSASEQMRVFQTNETASMLGEYGLEFFDERKDVLDVIDNLSDPQKAEEFRIRILHRSE